VPVIWLDPRLSRLIPIFRCFICFVAFCITERPHAHFIPNRLPGETPMINCPPPPPRPPRNAVRRPLAMRETYESFLHLTSVRDNPEATPRTLDSLGLLPRHFVPAGSWSPNLSPVKRRKDRAERMVQLQAVRERVSSRATDRLRQIIRIDGNLDRYRTSQLNNAVSGRSALGRYAHSRQDQAEAGGDIQLIPQLEKTREG
jgi:hypothetical protein